MTDKPENVPQNIQQTETGMNLSQYAAQRPPVATIAPAAQVRDSFSTSNKPSILPDVSIVGLARMTAGVPLTAGQGDGPGIKLHPENHSPIPLRDPANTQKEKLSKLAQNANPASANSDNASAQPGDSMGTKTAPLDDCAQNYQKAKLAAGQIEGKVSNLDENRRTEWRGMQTNKDGTYTQAQIDWLKQNVGQGTADRASGFNVLLNTLMVEQHSNRDKPNTQGAKPDSRSVPPDGHSSNHRGSPESTGTISRPSSPDHAESPSAPESPVDRNTEKPQERTAFPASSPEQSSLRNNPSNSPATNDAAAPGGQGADMRAPSPEGATTHHDHVFTAREERIQKEVALDHLEDAQKALSRLPQGLQDQFNEIKKFHNLAGYRDEHVNFLNDHGAPEAASSLQRYISIMNALERSQRQRQSSH